MLPCRLPHVALSEPFEALQVDLQSRLAYKVESEEAQSPQVLWENKRTTSVPVQTSGRLNAVAFWFEARAQPCHHHICRINVMC